ncbi:hypothetical protein Ahy_B03g068187 [Arachis hypogaea]|uniref:IBR domain-containing protein n=2 Tax=Arachis hypogaea TaxID=3818 RepID=A0A445A911_ARAHY|nr:hypothetical protein Ahy_B03g068187 [Arachis hypogaea]
MHPPYYCHNCISRYLVYYARFVTAQNVHCPDLKCTVKLDPMAFKILIPENIFDKWFDTTVKSALLSMEYQCCCPFYSELVINECKDKSVRKVKCPNCKEFCLKCQVP